MKNQLVSSVLATIWAFVAMAETEIPAQYKMDCWDHTFAYNRLEVLRYGQQVLFHSEGQDGSVFESLIGKQLKWGLVKLDFTVPLSHCKQLQTDPKVLTCASENLSVNVEISKGMSPEPIYQTIQMDNPVIQIRRIEELSIFGEGTQGYELVLFELKNKAGRRFTQRYVSGVSNSVQSELENCHVNR